MYALERESTAVNRYNSQPTGRGTTLADRNYLPLLVITESQNEAEKLNSILRTAGYAARWNWVSNVEDAESAIAQQMPDLIFWSPKLGDAELTDVIAMRDRMCPATPVLAIEKKYDEQAVTPLQAGGIHDVVTLDNGDRLKLIVARELDALRTARALQTAESLVREYQERFESFLQESGDAIAYIQDGIHVSSNPTYLELFGIESQDDLEGIPVMDLFAVEDQGKLKTMLKDAAKGKQVEPAKVKGAKSDGSTFDTTIELSQVELDGEPCIELAIRGEGDTSELEAQMEKMGSQMEELGKRDPLTGLYHRHHFVKLLTNEMKQSRNNMARGLLFIKPDSFSDIDDKVGPIASDQVLKLFAALIQQALGKKGVAARFGGNIFTAIVADKDFAGIEKWSQNLRSTVSTRIFEAAGQSTSMTCSIGIADFASEAKNPGALISLAQQANKQAREAGGNKVQIYKPAERDAEGKMLDAGWIKQIETALKENRFQLVYQPIASLEGDVSGMFDVLVRMLDKDGKEIMPNEFMPAAERNKLMVPIDRWIMANAFDKVIENAKEKKKVQVFIRLSAQSLTDDTTKEWVSKTIADKKVPADSVVFQISEENAESYLKEAKEFTDLAKKLKAGVAIEHFGKGRNPIQMFDHIKMSYIKIDGSFISELSNNDTKRDKVQEFIEKAREAAVQTIAERVETATTMAALWQLGINFIQGNYVQEPEVVMAEDARLPT
ncbi:MAG: EAL domain-containing protein [Gammaproteobacteria bacterium]|nr:EAL domain-containing protein [Gammaproteobacteria bacterium]